MTLSDKPTANSDSSADNTAAADSSARRIDPAKAAKIAIIDDEPLNVKIVRKHLQGVGYENFVTTSDSVTATAMVLREKPDVVLLDVMMPDVDGIQILEAIRADERCGHIPVLILTASTDAATKLRALNAGATDFLPKPVEPNDFVPRIRNALMVKAHHDHLANYSEQLEQQVRLRTAELELSRLQIVHCLARAGEYRDDTTGRHVIRVGRYSTILARELGWGDAAARMLGMAALLHDVGKIGLPDSILLKPGPLDPAEREVMKRHCDIGRRIVDPVVDDVCAPQKDPPPPLSIVRHNSGGTLLEMATTVALTHHEKWDGTGYPNRLAGEQIPLEGRIVAVADVFDALTSARPYKNAMSPSESLKIIEKDRGRHFDPNVLDALSNRLEDILRIYAEETDVRAAAA